MTGETMRADTQLAATQADFALEDGERPLVVAVIPTYRAQLTLSRVVARALEVVDYVIVVDDCCPEESSSQIQETDKVRLIRHSVNRGVGGATKTGILAAIDLDADIIVKIDSDDQMDVSYIPAMIDVFLTEARVDLVKGNRFADASTLRVMPVARLIGNAGLTLLVKICSGYWTIADPTNGFIAVRSDALRKLDLEKLNDRYFFEIDLLCAFGIGRRVIAEFEMPAIYNGGQSSLSIRTILMSFPAKLLGRLIMRLLVQYVVVEINVGSLCGLLGFPIFIFALFFGGHEWYLSSATGVGRPTGTIVLALLLFIIGFQLSLQAILFDVQFSTRTIKVAAKHAQHALRKTLARVER